MATENGMTNRVSARAFAKLDGCSHVRVLNGIKDGHLPVDADRKIDAALAKTGWRKGNRQAEVKELPPRESEKAIRRVPRSEPDEDDEEENELAAILTGDIEELAKRARQGNLFKNLAEAERVKETFVALLKQHDFNVKIRSVVPVESVAEIVGAKFAAVRTRLMALPSEIAPRVKGCKTVPETQAALLEAVTEALEEIASAEFEGAIQAGA